MQRIDLELGGMLGFRILSEEDRIGFEQGSGDGSLSCKIGGKDGTKDRAPYSTRISAKDRTKGDAPYTTRMGTKEGRFKHD